MELNSDFTKRVVLHGEQLPWQPSPMAGVERRMLDRIGEEVARATSIVRYAPHSKFSSHIHGGGEEFIVLEGVFQDEQGNYPAGSYIRNPPQSNHTPGSEPGCTIFVKLWQFDLQDRTSVRIDVHQMSAISDPQRPGVLVTPLFKDKREEVRIEEWQTDTEVVIDAPNGAELFVLEGSISEGKDNFHPQSWLRVPINSQIVAKAGANGAKVWLKTGHLPFVSAPKAT
ncbi:cupin domain-containing protein [Pleurocapsa sp. FMAR1]|uniref:cupin domain-containing protein n=1 Tax=Pleurocapsa sp. FMAR1 TaxID=3040204 RepID=UPI0039AFC2AA